MSTTQAALLSSSSTAALNSTINETRKVQSLALDITGAMNTYYTPTVLILGIICNTLNLIVMCSRSLRMHTTCNYMAAIAATDWLSSSINFVSWIYDYIEDSMLRDNSVVACKLRNFLLFFSVHASVCLMIAMTVEKFIAVVLPFRAKQWCTSRRCHITIVVILLSVTALNAHNLYTRELVTKEMSSGPRTRCLYSIHFAAETSTSQYFVLFIWPWIDATIYCFIPILLLTVLNICIIRTLKRKTPFGGSDSRYLPTKSGKDERLSVDATHPRNGHQSRKATAKIGTDDSHDINSSPRNLEGVVINVQNINTSKDITHKSMTDRGHTIKADHSVKHSQSKPVAGQVMVTCILVTSVFIVLILPFAVTLIVSRGKRLRGAMFVSFMVASNLTYTNHAINFFIYLSMPKFRKTLFTWFYRKH